MRPGIIVYIQLNINIRRHSTKWSRRWAYIASFRGLQVQVLELFWSVNSRGWVSVTVSICEGCSCESINNESTAPAIFLQNPNGIRGNTITHTSIILYMSTCNSLRQNFFRSPNNIEKFEYYFIKIGPFTCVPGNTATWRGPMTQTSYKCDSTGRQRHSRILIPTVKESE